MGSNGKVLFFQQADISVSRRKIGFFQFWSAHIEIRGSSRFVGSETGALPFRRNRV